MAHLPKLIEDLALILLAAGITTLLFRRLKQPLVLGYIIAGFLVGPHTHIMPTVVDTENINVWAEIGVIFLLFSLGLEFSFKKLARVGGAASVTAIVKVVGILGLGYMAGQWMGWSSMDSIFLGGILCISSTTIVIRALEELGLKNKQFARIVFGSLIIEDLVAILLLVLLSTLAVSRQFAGMEMLLSVGKLIFFLSLWFLSGIFILPTILKKAKKLLNDEILLIVSLALCLCLVVLATHTGFSPALGAFVMGSILAETTLAERIEHLIIPVKDLFGAVFFVSVGILIDPTAMLEHGWAIFWVTLLTIFGKMIATTFGALLSGQPLKQSLQVGMSMAQIGEFAFIVATLGITLGVTSDFLFPVAVGASAITTFTTPYFIKLSEPFYNLLVKVLPPRWMNSIKRYSSGAQNIQAESEWKGVLQSYAVIVGMNAVIAIAIILLTTTFLAPISRKYIESQWLAHLLVMLITIGFASPFFWAMMVRKPQSSAFTDLWLDRKYNRGPLLIIEVSRNILAVLIFGLLLDRLYSSSVALVAGLVIFTVVMFIFSKKLQHFYARIESRFLKNLNARELAASDKDSPLSP
ncbi:MAG: cation:proton antiporter, partial [Flavihumibacter sp.]